MMNYYLQILLSLLERMNFIIKGGTRHASTVTQSWDPDLVFITIKSTHSFYPMVKLGRVYVLVHTT